MLKWLRYLMIAFAFTVICGCGYFIYSIVTEPPLEEDVILVKDVIDKEDDKVTGPIIGEVGEVAEGDNSIVTPKPTAGVSDESSVDIDDSAKDETPTPTPTDVPSSIIVDKPISGDVDSEIVNESGEEQRIYEDGEIILITNIIKTDPVTGNEVVVTVEKSKEEKELIASRNKKRVKVQNFKVELEDSTILSFGDMFKDEKPIVVGAWVKDDADSEKQFEVWQKIYDEYKDRVNFLFIQCDYKAQYNEKLVSSLHEKGYTFPLGFDYTWGFIGTHKVYSYPTTLYMNTDGYIVNTVAGKTSEKLMLKNIDKLLEEQKTSKEADEALRQELDDNEKELGGILPN